MPRNKESIIYLNFAPYENAGRILDFLVDYFHMVVLFSFNFHKLNNRNQSNYIRVYRRGKIVEQIKLFELPTPEGLLFISLPFITVLIACQTLWHIIRLKRQVGGFDRYLSVNAFTSWLGNLLRRFGVVRQTVFWVWDYYPPGYPDWRIRLARWGYWQFDKWSTRSSSRTVFLNQRLLELRQAIGVVKRDKVYPIVPIGTNPGRIEYNKAPIIGHLGVLKQSQGLDLLFDCLPALLSKQPKLRVEIVGSGPDEAHFRGRAKDFANVTFHGFVKEENKVDTIIRQWSVGVATYRPDKSSPAAWTDPSKMKAYISQGVPIVTTKIAPFGSEVARAGAGLIVSYSQPDAFCQAVLDLISHQKSYKEKAFALAQQYAYQKLYPKLFFDD